ncbi:DUF2071 domain-containing protein, partial [Bacillus sp. AF56]
DERGSVQRADIHHAPWLLQPASAHVDQNTLAPPYGIELPHEPPLVHFSSRQDVVIWAPRPI